jgi:hypothetical protein
VSRRRCQAKTLRGLAGAWPSGGRRVVVTSERGTYVFGTREGEPPGEPWDPTAMTLRGSAGASPSQRREPRPPSGRSLALPGQEPRPLDGWARVTVGEGGPRRREGEPPGEPPEDVVGGAQPRTRLSGPRQDPQFTLIGPMIRVLDQSVPNRIVSDVLPLGLVTLRASEARVPEPTLPITYRSASTLRYQ